jgi:glutamine synthetase
MSSKVSISEWDENNNKSLEFLQVRYTDVLGRFLARYLSMPADIEGFFKHGIGLDGSSVRGFAYIDDSDLLLLPDRSTAKTVPLLSKQRMIGAVIANVYKGFGQGRLDTDPRYTTQRMQKYLGGKDMLCQLGPEVECFVLDDIKFASNNDCKQETVAIISCEHESCGGKYPIMSKQGYDCPPFQDSLVEFRFHVAEILKRYYSIKVTNLNHEVASGGQIEINFNHGGLTESADNVQIFKDVVRNEAKAQGKIAIFMPKPFFDENDSSGHIDNGSGMHVNVSIWQSNGKKNLFYDPDDKYAEVSQTGRYFIGGILEHSSSLSAIVAPTINSYHRLIPGFEAPVYLAWSRGNRSAVVRVPAVEKNSAKSKRIEFRAPDPSANPYLAFSAIAAAGIDGISKKIEPGDPVNENIYKLSESRKRAFGIKPLPSSLQEALAALKNDHMYLQSCFATELLQSYLALKEHEIKEGNRKGRSWQIRRYYDV